MLIDGVIENGQIRLLRPVQFVHDYFTVKVDVPEDEIVPRHHVMTRQNEPSRQTEEVTEFKKLSNALFGDDYRYVPEKSDQEILGEVLSDKYA
jgi:hypothetical protein